MDNPPLLVTIILAAGESRRMGEPKLFLPIRGESMLRKAVFAALDLGHPLVVVTGAYHDQIKDHLSDIDGLQLVFNPAWSTGMSTSIACGIEVALSYQPRGFFITLADQPSMSVESLGAIDAIFLEDQSRIVATYYPERLGVPAIFPARYADQLLNGKGPNGARQLIAAAGGRVKAVKFHVPPIDIDTPEEYQRYMSEYQRTKEPKNK
ncbi:MAG: nucleotidyltransferase family protein [Bacteroidota bacterium]